MFSRKAKYGLIACIRLARGGTSRRLLIQEISELDRIPPKFLGAILLDLRYAGLLKSKRGRGGGYYLSRAPEAITMADILKALNGPLVPFRCVAIRSDKTCEECVAAGYCALRLAMTDVNAQLHSIFASINLASLAKDAWRLEQITQQPTATVGRAQAQASV